MSAPPYMPLYVADYLGDTRHLTTEQHGAYLLLLMAMWRAGGTLPDDGEKLARMAGLSKAKWARIGADVMALFQTADGSVFHERVRKELEKYARTCEIRSEFGSRGGRAKALKTKEPDLAKATNLLDENSSKNLANQNHNQNHKSSVDKSTDAKGVDLNAEAWRMAVAVLTSQGGLTEPKARAFFGKLLKGITAADMLPAVSQAALSKTQDPQGYLTGASDRLRRKGPSPALPEKRVGFV